MHYPKKLISPDGTIIHAKQAVHEADLRAEGYTDAPAEKAPEKKAALPCAKCAELQAEVESLKAQLAKALEPQTGGGETAPTGRGRRAKA